MQKTSDFLLISTCFHPVPCSLIKPVFLNVMLVMVYFQMEQMERSPGGHLFNGNGKCESVLQDSVLIACDKREKYPEI